MIINNLDERSQHKNKAKALTILRARLYEKEREAAIQKRADLLQEQGNIDICIDTTHYPRVSPHHL